MTTTGPRNSKKLFQHGPNWSDLPLDILEHIIGRLHWVDRIRIRAVCKAWSVPNTHIPAIDELPWAMEFCWGYDCVCVSLQGECRLVNPLFREYFVEERHRGIECRLFLDAEPCASLYGWVLFKVYNFIESKKPSLFLYSPFTDEVIKLPYVPLTFQVATFALNATSPKCTIFLLWKRYGTIYIRLCSAGDCSWQNFEFLGFDRLNRPVDAAYANGVFYCVFEGGQLGAFNVELKEWTILVDDHRLAIISLFDAKLIVSDADLRLVTHSPSLELLKLDFSKMVWVYENDLNNRVLFIGCTSFSAPAVGETSQLANTIFASDTSDHEVRFFGSTSPSRSLLYHKCVEAAVGNMTWIEVPSGGIWRADDLIHAV